MAVPHLALPIRFDDGKVATVEQDSIDDIAQRAETVLRYRPGDLDHEPEFGLPDPAFSTDDPALLVDQALAEWEPRAEALTETTMDGLIAAVEVEVAGG